MQKIRLDIFLLVTAVLLTTCASFFRIMHDRGNENKRLTSNVTALTSEIHTFKTKDGKQSAEVKTLTLTVSELKEQNEAYVRELKTLDIKARDVKAIQEIGTVSTYSVPLTKYTPDFKEQFRQADSVFNARYHHSDEWINIDVKCWIDTCQANIQVRDSILVIQHAKTRRFLFWTWKKYSGTTTIKNYNPYSSTQQITSITIEK